MKEQLNVLAVLIYYLRYRQPKGALVMRKLALRVQRPFERLSELRPRAELPVCIRTVQQLRDADGRIAAENERRALASHVHQLY